MIDVDELAAEAVREIVRDLSGRAGLDGAWDAIDEDVQLEIMVAWEQVICGAFVDAVDREDGREKS